MIIESNFEEIWVEIVLNKEKLLLGTLYLPTNKLTPELIYNHLKYTLKNVTNNWKYDKTIIWGDFNFNFNFDWNMNRNNSVFKLNRMFNWCRFKQMVKEITYEWSDSILDLIFTNKEQIIKNWLKY